MKFIDILFAILAGTSISFWHFGGKQILDYLLFDQDSLGEEVDGSVIGVDASTSVSQSSMSNLIATLKDNQWGAPFDLFISRVYTSNGHVDQTGIANYRNAVNAGISHVHAYIFPDVGQGNPAGQVKAAIDALVSAGLAPNTIIWLDVENYNWPADQGANQNFIQQMVDYKSNLPSGARLGIYSSYYNW